jgi:hypothetical protein
MKSSRSTRSSKGTLLSLAVLCLTGSLLAFVLGRSGDSETVSRNPGLSSQPRLANALEEGQGGGTGETCLAAGVPAQKVSELVARVESAGRADGSAETTVGSLEVTAEEAENLLRFDARFPEAPPGWTLEVKINPTTPARPFERCVLESAIRDPTIVETVTFPEASGLTHEGEPYVLPAETIEIYKQAQVGVFPVQGPIQEFAAPGTPGTTSTWLKVQGADALVFTRDYDEPSVAVVWQDAGLQIGVACSLMTVEECLAVAESVN